MCRVPCRFSTHALAQSLAMSELQHILMSFIVEQEDFLNRFKASNSELIDDSTLPRADHNEHEGSRHAFNPLEINEDDQSRGSQRFSDFPEHVGHAAMNTTSTEFAASLSDLGSPRTAFAFSSFIAWAVLAMCATNRRDPLYDSGGKVMYLGLF